MNYARYKQIVNTPGVQSLNPLEFLYYPKRKFIRCSFTFLMISSIIYNNNSIEFSFIRNIEKVCRKVVMVTLTIFNGIRRL